MREKKSGFKLKFGKKNFKREKDPFSKLGWEKENFIPPFPNSCLRLMGKFTTNPSPKIPKKKAT